MSHELEIHLTLSHPSIEDYKGCFNDFLEEYGYKFTHIELNKGKHVTQQMVTRRVKGNLLHEFSKIFNEHRFKLLKCGYVPVRIKIEVPPWSELVSLFKTDDTYYEAHIKVKIHQKDEGLLALAAQEVNGHLSKNAFKELDGDYNERFITIRMKHNLFHFQRTVEEAVAFLEKERFEVLEVEQEYCIYDSNLDLDKGWAHV